MLVHRLLAALILIPVVIAALFFLSLNYFVAVVIAISGVAAWEWGQFLGIKNVFKRVCLGFGWAFFLTLIYYFSPKNILLIIFNAALLTSLAWWLVALLLVLTYPQSATSWQSSYLKKSAFLFFTLFPFFVGMITLRQYQYNVDSYAGAWWLLYILILVWATDTGAYFAGRVFGKKKLAPKVSPGKTLEGFIGGVATASILVLIVTFYFVIPVSIYAMIVSSIFAILASVLGDLTESMFKREAGIKDSGNLIPGHGGILDRIDSLTAAIPVFVALAFFIG